MSVTTIDSSPSQDYTHPDDQTTPSNSTPGLKPFTLSDCYVKAGKYEIQKPLSRNMSKFIARQVEGFCISYFAAFSISRIFSL